MTLHEAIITVLEGAGRPATTSEIASWIADRDLWCRPSDGQHPPARQIRWRMTTAAYRHLFLQTGDAWGLAAWDDE